MSIPLTFGELLVGDHFIGFPQDGDDSGHGGYRSEFHVFKKVNRKKKNKIYAYCDNAQRLRDKNYSHFPGDMPVCKVIIK